MKVRKGFVSNSSSSSFIVEFPMEVKSADDLKELLDWKDFDALKYRFSEKVTREDLCNALFDEIQWFSSYNDKRSENDMFKSRCEGLCSYEERDKFGFSRDMPLIFIDVGNEASGLGEHLDDGTASEKEASILFELEYNGVLEELLSSIPYVFSSHR